MHIGISTLRNSLPIAAYFTLVAVFCIPESAASQHLSFHQNQNLVTTRLPDPMLSGLDISPPRAAQAVHFQDRLLSIARNYMKRVDVPYIWGGGNIGSQASCNECRACVLKKQTPLARRLHACPPCQSCGIDCSHFVYRLYQQAGLTYNYASSWELSRQTPKRLIELYNMVDIGKDLTLAQPGDLLVFKKHITMLVRALSPTRGDFIHVTRFRPGDRHKLGGFRWDKNQDILNYRGKLVRILRHSRFFKDPENFTLANPVQMLRDKITPSI